MSLSSRVKAAADDSSTDNDPLTVGKIGSTGGNTHFLGQLATVAITCTLLLTADESGSVVDFGDFWTNDGDITITRHGGSFNSGIGNIGRLIARDAVVDEGNTGKITVAETTPFRSWVAWDSGLPMAT